MDGRIGEDKAAPAQEHSVEAFYQSAVQVTCEARTLDVLDAEVYGAVLTSADGVGRIRELDLNNKVELRREHLAAAQEPDEGGRHENFLKVRLRQGVGEAADFVDLQALVGLVDPPLTRLQQCVQVHRSGVVVDVVRALAVGEKLNSIDQAGGVSHDWGESRWRRRC